ncbi:MarR family winged helix-turn-helix transcriptional regulator [Actinomadura sp. CNU-125]|uniref:MarR family winged helix-turn-helix transcriptional regulator n=1 Tax=Actinomadura sp. CNU-125 TaxID=1904961 RepID=UPI0021CCEE9E|nr:MarR family transcriptional regulator [Actinomadura sp. CNU-125]
MATGEQIGLGGALVRITFLVNSLYTEVSREYGLTPQQGKLLCVVLERPYGMRELGQVLGLAKSSLTGLVDRTAQHGLVRREPDARDARAVQVAITEPGERVADAFHRETIRRVEELPAHLGHDDRDRLLDLLGSTVLVNEARALAPAPDDCG